MSVNFSPMKWRRTLWMKSLSYMPSMDVLTAVWWLVLSGMFVSVVVCFTGDILTQPDCKNKQWCNVSWRPPGAEPLIASPSSRNTAVSILIMSFGDNPHLLLGRIRFFNNCIECFKSSEPLPESLYYVPKEVCYKICKDSSTSSSSGPSGGGSIGGKTLIAVYENPNQTPHKKLCKYNIEPKKGACIRTTGDEYRNSQGLWVKITKVSVL